MNILILQFAMDNGRQEKIVIGKIRRTVWRRLVRIPLPRQIFILHSTLIRQL